MTEEEMVGWHHQLNGQKSEQILGDGKGQGSLVCCSPWGHKGQDTTEQLNKNNKTREVNKGDVTGESCTSDTFSKDCYNHQRGRNQEGDMVLTAKCLPFYSNSFYLYIILVDYKTWS